MALRGLCQKRRKNSHESVAKADPKWAGAAFLPATERPEKGFCQSFIGRGYSDNPKPLAEELLRRGYSVYWTVKGEKEAASLPKEIHPVFLGTFGEIYHRATAGVWIDNCRKWGHLFKRPGQYYIQTWHGFPLKRIEGDAVEALDPEYVETAKKDSQMADQIFQIALETI